MIKYYHPTQHAYRRAGARRDETVSGDGRKHYAVVLAHKDGAMAETVAHNLTGTRQDNLADALALAEVYDRKGAWARKLGLYYYAARIA